MPKDVAPPQPAMPLFVLGDVHGRLDLLEQSLGWVADEIAVLGHRRVEIVCLGDYVDRGPDSRGVLEGLIAFEHILPGVLTCLMGNHETMLLDFIDDPETRGGNFLRNGGDRTLASFGIGGVTERVDKASLLDTAKRLRTAMGQELEAWLRQRPLWHRSGDVVCVHAAMDPAKPPEAQSTRTLLWGTRSFHKRARRDGLWVVHGHTVVDTPSVRDRRVAIDTGAYFSDRLTVAVFHPGEPVRFLTTGV